MAGGGENPPHAIAGGRDGSQPAGATHMTTWLYDASRAAVVVRDAPAPDTSAVAARNAIIAQWLIARRGRPA